MLLTSVADRWRDPVLLDHLARVRKPWDALTRRIVCAVAAKWLLSVDGPFVEIGAGGGQLRDWLPPEVAAITIHSEPSEPLLAALRVRYPAAISLGADATALPFAHSSVGAVLGLCVLDTMDDLAGVRDEIRRVLRPGGVFVHFLDLSTSPDCLFPELIAGGELPLTNFAGDPTLLAALTEEQKAALPPSDEFDEVLAIRWEPFMRLVGLLRAARHPLMRDLGPYAELSQPGALDLDRLTRGFIDVSGDAVRLAKLNRALLALTLTAKQQGREWPLRAISTRTYLRGKLQQVFGTAHGFAVEFAGPVAAREVTPTDRYLPPGTRYVLRHAGRTRMCSDVARELHGVSFLGTELACRGITCASAVAVDTIIRETTVEVIVARRQAGAEGSVCGSPSPPAGVAGTPLT